MNLDMRNIKWGWPGYLTFGKTKEVGSLLIPTTPLDWLKETPKEEGGKDLDYINASSMNVDTESLQDAISSDNAHSTRPSSPAHSHIAPSPAPSSAALRQEDGSPIPAAPSIVGPDEEKSLGSPSPNDNSHEEPPHRSNTAQNFDEKAQDIFPSEDVTITLPEVQEVQSAERNKSLPPLEVPPLLFLPTTVHLADEDAPTVTRKMRVWHATVCYFIFSHLTSY